MPGPLVLIIKNRMSVRQSVSVSSAFHRRRRARRLKISHDDGRGPMCPETCNRGGPTAGRHVARAHVRHWFSMETGELRVPLSGPQLGNGWSQRRAVNARRQRRDQPGACQAGLSSVSCTCARARTCMTSFYISGTAGPIALKFEMWVVPSRCYGWLAQLGRGARAHVRQPCQVH